MYYKLYLGTEFKSLKRKLIEHYDTNGTLDGFYYLQPIYDNNENPIIVIPWIKAVEADPNGMMAICIAKIATSF